MYLLKWGCLLSCLLLFAPLQAATVYRCVQPDGSLSFQQQACAGQGGKIESGEVQTSWSPLRKGEVKLFKAYLDADEARYQRKLRLWKTQSGESTKTVETRSCWSKRRQYESARAKLRRGYKPSQGSALRRKRDAAQDYLQRYCP